MSVYERISVVVSLTLIGLALYFVLDFSGRPIDFILFGTPLVLEAPRQLLMAFLLAGLAMAGTDAVMRAHPFVAGQRLGYLVTFWMLPGLLVILATQILGLAPNALAWAGGLIGVGLLLWLTLITEYYQASPDHPLYGLACLWQKVVGYSLVLALFVVIYYPRSRGALSATGILAVSSMVTLALLRQKPETISKTWLFAMVIGLSLGQITWALNYWRVSTLQAGLFLFLIFYGLVGLAQHQLSSGSLPRRVLWEFGAIGAALLLVIFYL